MARLRVEYTQVRSPISGRAGNLLISAGEPNRFLYLVLSGRLSVRLRSPQAAPITRSTA